MKTNLSGKYASDLGCEEIFDPTHLPQEEQSVIQRAVEAKKAGADIADDPIVRGFVNGHIMRTIGEDMSESGYDEKETPEISEYINKLTDAQYEGTMGTLKTFNLYDPEQPQEGDVPAPTLEHAKEIFANQVTPEQLEAIKGMEKPTLQLIPITSMNRYIKALDSCKPMEKQDDAYVPPWHREAFESADKRDGVTGNDTIIGWRIAVTEGAKEPKILPGDNIEESLRDRNIRFKQECGSRGVSGVDLKRMFASMMESLKNGEPLNDYCRDNGTWTFANEEGEKDGRVSGVYWSVNDRRVNLSVRYAARQSRVARFRASVMVDVPKS